MMDLLRSVGLNRYELNARLKPALLALLPVIIITLFWHPGAWTTAGSVVAIASACGVLYAMAQLARYRGRKVERSLRSEIGRAHTAKLLTHADDTFMPETKARYHAYLLGNRQVLSSADEESAEPDLAFRRARSAVDWLLENTKAGKNSPILLEENISYGFQRNLYGLKPFGVGLSLAAIVTHVFLLILRFPQGEQLGFGLAICAALVIVLFSWIFLVTKNSVADASLAYAQRLLAHCEPTATASRARRAPASTDQSGQTDAKSRKRKASTASSGNEPTA